MALDPLMSGSALLGACATLQATARLLIRDAGRLRAEVRASCDGTRLTRAWSQELRRRAMRCVACHHPLRITDAMFIVGYVPAGRGLTEGPARVHPRCLVRWITMCRESDPGHDVLPT